MPTTCSVSERQSTDPDTGARKPTPNNSPFDELIAAAAALVMRCCSGDAQGLLSCDFCQRISELGRPIVHTDNCPVGRVQRAGVKAKCRTMLSDYLRALEMTLAYEAATGQIEGACTVSAVEGDAIYFDLDDIDEYADKDGILDNVQYLEARRLIQRHPEHPNWIALCDEGEPQTSDAPAGRSMAHSAPELPVRRVLSAETAAKIPEVRRAATIAAGHHRGPCCSFRELVTPDFVLDLLGLVPEPPKSGNDIRAELWRVPEDDLASPVESDGSWQPSAVELQARETGQVGGSNAFPPLGADTPAGIPPQGEAHIAAPVRVEPDPDRERRRVVCGQVIAIYGHPGRTTLLCDLHPDHGDAFHTDRTANLSWGRDVYEIHVQPSGVMEMRQLEGEPFYVHPRPAFDGLRPDGHLGAVEAEAVTR